MPVYIGEQLILVHEPITNVRFRGPTGGYNDITGTIIHDAKEVLLMVVIVFLTHVLQMLLQL